MLSYLKSLLDIVRDRRRRTAFLWLLLGGVLVGAALCTVSSPLVCSMIQKAEGSIRAGLASLHLDAATQQQVVEKLYEILGCRSDVDRLGSATAKFLANWQSILTAAVFVATLVSGRIAGRPQKIDGVVTKDPGQALAATAAPLARDRLAQAWIAARRDVARLAVRRRALAVMIVYAMASGVLTALVPLSSATWELSATALPHLLALSAAAIGAAVWGVAGSRWRTIDVRLDAPTPTVVASIRLEPTATELAVDLGWSPILLGGVIATCIGLPYQLPSLKADSDLERNTALVMLGVRCLLLPALAAAAVAGWRCLQAASGAGAADLERI